MGFFDKLKAFKNKITDPLFDIEEWEEPDDKWDKIVYDRADLKITDRKSREEYVRGCLEQIAEASNEVDALQLEYEAVTSSLKDMEEIEALPREEMELLRSYAREIDKLKDEQSDYLKRQIHMNEEKYRKLESMEEEISEGYDKLKEAEDYQKLIKKDLKRLENEKQAYFARRADLRNIIADSKTMLMVCTIALVITVVILLILQYGLSLNTRIGYLAAALAGAIGITMIFIRHNDSVEELKGVDRGITRLIQLQNTVKIRYVNNTNLLDYLYIKYQVSSSSELGKDYEQFKEEREERRKYHSAEISLDECETKMLHELRRYQIKDPMIWLHQTEAILDKREMVEIRHKLIIQRQALRRRIDYNREVVALNAHNEIKDLVANYPKYSAEILKIVNEYEQKYK